LPLSGPVRKRWRGVRRNRVRKVWPFKGPISMEKRRISGADAEGIVVSARGRGFVEGVVSLESLWFQIKDVFLAT
jgi:hypothetical protein